MKTRGKTLIKRFTLPLYHRSKVKDPTSSSRWSTNDNMITEIVTEVAQECTLQPMNKQQMTADLNGLNINDIFILRTNTSIYPAIEGSDFIGSGIYIPPCYFAADGATFVPSTLGGYYNCVDVKHWNNGTIPHFEAIVVKDYTMEDDAYPVEKVSATAAEMLTLTQLKNGDWEQGWIA